MKKILTSNKYYELTFILLLASLILFWSVSIVNDGSKSSQSGLFFRKLEDFWADRINVVGYSSLLDPYNNTMYTGVEEKGYPPLVYVMMYLSSRLVNMQPYYEANKFLEMYQEPLFLLFVIHIIILTYIVGFMLIRNAKSGSRMVKSGTALVLLLSGPMLYTFERGNIILWIPFLCLAFIQFYDSENRILKEIGIICLAIAAGIKMTPAILGIILIVEKRWKEAFRAVIYGVVMFIGPFFLLKGGISNISLMFRNLGILMEKYADAEGCSIRNIFGTFEKLFGLQDTSVTIVSIVTILVSVCLLLCAFFSKKKWEKVMALTLIFMTAPNYAGYYCLIYLIPSITLFLNDETHRISDILILMSGLFIFNPVQSQLIQFGFDYHLGVVLSLVVLIYRGISYSYGGIMKMRRS